MQHTHKFALIDLVEEIFPLCQIAGHIRDHLKLILFIDTFHHGHHGKIPRHYQCGVHSDTGFLIAHRCLHHRLVYFQHRERQFINRSDAGKAASIVLQAETQTLSGHFGQVFLKRLAGFGHRVL